MLCFSITYSDKTSNMTKQPKHKPQTEYTDKRTGIVYTNINHAVDEKNHEAKMQPHLDAFLSNAFLKTYFGPST